MRDPGTSVALGEAGAVGAGRKRCAGTAANADLKERHALGLGGAFAAALAMATGSPLLTGDAELLPLAEHGLAIEWVGEPHGRPASRADAHARLRVGRRGTAR